MSSDPSTRKMVPFADIVLRLHNECANLESQAAHLQQEI